MLDERNSAALVSLLHPARVAIAANIHHAPGQLVAAAFRRELRRTANDFAVSRVYRTRHCTLSAPLRYVTMPEPRHDPSMVAGAARALVRATARKMRDKIAALRMGRPPLQE